MEEEKRKKKNKKKRGKQTKTSDVVVSARETSFEQNLAPVMEQNHYRQFSGTSDAEIAGMLENDTSFDERYPDGVILDEAEKEIWLQRVRCLEEELKKLQRSWIWKEASLDGEIKGLKIEKDCYIQREGGLVKRIIQLQSEKDAWLQKEANLEDKTKHLERDKDSWALREKSSKEAITRLNEENMGLHTQVEELEESRNSLFQENQRLMETISDLQSQIQHLEKKTFSSFSTSVTAGHSSMAASDLAEVTSETATVADDKFRQKMSESGEKVDPPVSIQSKDERIGSDNADKESTIIAGIQMEESSIFYDAGKIEEIVQIPVDDNEIQDAESQVAEIDRNDSVPLSEAPLIGAPFRLISFVAKYVSGADLVTKNTKSSAR